MKSSILATYKDGSEWNENEDEEDQILILIQT
jgi:hypothetical protein